MKNKIIAGVIIAAVLVFAFVWGGNAPATGEIPASDEPLNITEKEVPPSAETVTEEQTKEEIPVPEMVIIPETGKDEYQTDPVPDGRPLPVEPQDAVISDKEYTCTLSIRCDTILENMSYLDSEKAELVPKDGIILSEREVTFYEGESVFNVLLRETKRNNIHLEFVNTPIYNSVYIEGINNIYEFDCGELSGWMYKVNDWFPNYGSSRYALKDGDKISWIYTCDLGKDVGGVYWSGREDE